MPESPNLDAIRDEEIDSGLGSFYAEEEQRRLYEQQEARHIRAQRTRSLIHWVSLIVLSVVSLVAVAFLSVWAWHFVAAESLHFLSDSQLDGIEAILVSIVSSSFLTGVAKNWLSTHTE